MNVYTLLCKRLIESLLVATKSHNTCLQFPCTPMVRLGVLNRLWFTTKFAFHTQKREQEKISTEDTKTKTMTSTDQSEYEHIVFGMCNPLLDISADVPNEFLEKYQVAPATAILAEEKHLPIYKELTEKYKVKYTAGGSAQNVLRVYQWMLQNPNSATFVGCVGNDEYGKLLRENATRDGLNVQYLVDETKPTGTCAVLVVGKERSLIANLGAANEYKHSHLLSEEIQQYVKKAQYFYFSGFFLTVSPESVMYIGEYAAKTNKIFMINLSAQFIVTFFKEKLLAALPYADFLFGNESEALEFSKMMGYNTENVPAIAEKVSLYEKVNTKRKRIVVFTQGPDPVVVAVDGKSHLVEVPSIFYTSSFCWRVVVILHI